MSTLKQLPLYWCSHMEDLDPQLLKDKDSHRHVYACKQISQQTYLTSSPIQESLQATIRLRLNTITSEPTIQVWLLLQQVQLSSCLHM
jgi:hypothetical protein